MTTISKTGYDLYDLLIAIGFNDMYSRFIVSQAAHESANFTSKVFTENNNPFGIKYFNQDEADGEKNGYAYYGGPDNKTAGLFQAVKDYRRIFKGYGLVSLSSLESFVKLLQDRRYFEATYLEYLNGCKWFYNLYFPKGWDPTKIPVNSGTY